MWNQVELILALLTKHGKVESIELILASRNIFLFIPQSVPFRLNSNPSHSYNILIYHKPEGKWHITLKSSGLKIHSIHCVAFFEDRTNSRYKGRLIERKFEKALNPIGISFKVFKVFFLHNF